MTLCAPLRVVEATGLVALSVEITPTGAMKISPGGLDKKHRPAPIIRTKQPNHHRPGFSRRADGAHYCHRYIWLRRFGWSLTLVGHAVFGASVEPPVVAPRAAGAISQQFDRTQQDPRRKALHKSGAGVFTSATRKANDAPRGGRRQATIAKPPPTDCVTMRYFHTGAKLGVHPYP